MSLGQDLDLCGDAEADPEGEGDAVLTFPIPPALDVRVCDGKDCGYRRRRR
jgi:hypothetical protein